MKRRSLLKGTMPVLLAHSLLGSLYARRALAGPLKSDLAAWVGQIDERCRDLGRASLGQDDWQAEIERLLSSVSIPDLLAAIEFERLEAQLAYPDLGVDTRRVRFPALATGDARLNFYPKLFGMAPGRAIIPHGHRHMASAHLVLGGEFHLRQFERIESNEQAWIVEPVIDEFVGPGTASSISDESKNIHWLVAGEEKAWTLDVIVTNLDEGEKAFDIQNLDPDNAERVSGGLLRMPTLDVATALKRYGHHHHG